MSINANMIVNVTTRAIRAGSDSLEFNTLLLTGSEIASHFGRYESAESVASVFGSDSLEHRFAVDYFAADVYKTRAPSALCIACDYAQASHAFLRSSRLPDLEVLKTISNGAFTISVGGESVSVTSLNLSGATSYAQVASTIQEKIAGTKVTFDEAGHCLYIKTDATGAEATLSYPEGEDADKLGISEKSGGVLVQGVAVKTPFALMTDISGISRNWVTFTHTKEQEATRAVEFGKWVSAQEVSYIYLPYTQESSAITAGSVSDLASKLVEAGVSYVAPIYGDMEYAAFFGGMIASTDWRAINGVKNYAFKQSAFLPANVSHRPTAEVLNAKGYNYIGNFATRNAEFQISYRGTILGKTFHFIDEVAGMIWLANEVQRVLMDGLSAVNRVPYNPSGYNMIRNWMLSPIDAGLRNGYIQEGVELSATQKTQLTQEVGKDVSKEVFNEGFHLVVGAPSAEDRAKRKSPDVRLYFTYGGAVLKIDPTVTAML